MITFKKFLEQSEDTRTLRQVIQKDHGADVKRYIADTLGVDASGIQIDAATGREPLSVNPNGLGIYIDIHEGDDEDFFKKMTAKVVHTAIARYFKRPFAIENLRVFDGRQDKMWDEAPGGSLYFVCLDVRTL